MNVPVRDIDALNAKLDWDKGEGILPAVVQDAQTDRVLMVGYVSPESLGRTARDGRVTFFSRRRRELWTKGETSGHVLRVVEIVPDCDLDTVLIRAVPDGPTCHRGTASCFDGAGTALTFLGDLQRVIAQRDAERPAESYTTRLLEDPARAAQKVGEEAVEVVVAAMREDRAELIEESADLLYHLLVLLQGRDVNLTEVVERLADRHRAPTS